MCEQNRAASEKMLPVLCVKSFGKKREDNKSRKDRCRRKWSDLGHFLPCSGAKIPCFMGFWFSQISPFCGHSALKSLGRDTIPVRARSAAPQRWENESVLSSLFFAHAYLFGSVYSIDEFFRPVNRAGRIFRFK